jgi:hypothetical protein
MWVTPANKQVGGQIGSPAQLTEPIHIAGSGEAALASTLHFLREQAGNEWQFCPDSLLPLRHSVLDSVPRCNV